MEEVSALCAEPARSERNRGIRAGLKLGATLCAECARRGLVRLVERTPQAHGRLESGALRDLLDTQHVVPAVDQKRLRETCALPTDLARDAVLGFGEDELELAQRRLHFSRDLSGREARVTALLGDHRDRPVAQYRSR